MKKRIISGLLAVWMLCALLPGAAAAPALPTEEEAAQVLAALEIMVGDENGNLNLDKKVSRAEFIKMAVAATPGGTGVGSAAISPYSDVPRSHWAAGYIQTAVETGLITGYLDGTFRPDNTITLAEGVTVALRLLGWQNSDFSATYPTGQMAKYRDLDLDRGVSVGQNDQLSRRDCMYLFHNLLTAPSRSANSPYICVLGHALTASGQIDRVELISSAMEGPVVISEGWTKQVTFDPSSARTVYRDGKQADYSDLLDNDVVYYSKSMRTLWAYSKKATGTVTAITPVGQDHMVRVRIPAEYLRYTIDKGSICIDGISLTIAAIHAESSELEFWITPHTWQRTVMHVYEVGSIVNIEVDMIAKYVEKMFHPAAN